MLSGRKQSNGKRKSMSILGNIFRRLFERAPKHHTSAYRPLRASVVACLKGAGLKAGGTAGYPRVEVHTITENQRLDKEGAVRSLSLTIESISDRSMLESAEMNETAMSVLTAEGALEMPEGWTVLDVVPDQLQELPETSDSAKILYRTLQGYDVLVERVKEEPEVVDPEEANQGEAEDPGEDEGQEEETEQEVNS